MPILLHTRFSVEGNDFAHVSRDVILTHAVMAEGLIALFAWTPHGRRIDYPKLQLEDSVW